MSSEADSSHRNSDVETERLQIPPLRWGLDLGWRDMFVATSSDSKSVHCGSAEFKYDSKYSLSKLTMQGWQDRD
ncbi:hypothetical protein PybrP1_006204, partial [[Pythium] brassicae (nom. inval.)]